MATINSSQSPQSSSAPWFKLVVTEVTSPAPATKARLSYSFYYMTKGYATDSIARPYSISINGSPVKTGSATVANITSSETLITSGTTDVDRTDSTKSVAISFTVAWQVYWSGTYKASHDGSGSISISPKTYTVTYNANSGSGAPSAQTKTGGVTLTLSSTKPTRTGYSFLNWNTKSDGTGSKYAPGGSYTANAAVTLYAQWDPIKYSVVYDTNGGTGVIEQQTKTYGTVLQLTTTKPSRTYYDFVNWCTDPNGLGDVYESGGVYTGNANLKLYAIWTLAYVPPKISNITAVRCLDSSGSVEDPYQGTYARVEFDWECDQNLGPNPAVITVAGESISTGGAYSGHVQYTIARTRYSPELSYSISIVVQDNYDATTSSISLTTSEYCIDFKAGGKGVCVGGVATKDRTFECVWPAEFPAGATIGGASVVTVETLLDVIYPVGSIYMSVNNVSPQVFLGGTWERIYNRFLLAADDSVTGRHGSDTGGSATHTLTTSEMPSHSHNPGTLKASSNGSHVHSLPNWKNVGTDVVMTAGLESWGSGDTPRTINSGSAGSHEHSITGSTANAGSGTAFSIMPPYLAVYMWKRTA